MYLQFLFEEGQKLIKTANLYPGGDEGGGSGGDDDPLPPPDGNGG